MLDIPRSQNPKVKEKTYPTLINLQLIYPPCPKLPHHHSFPLLFSPQPAMSIFKHRKISIINRDHLHTQIFQSIGFVYFFFFKKNVI